MTKKAKGRMPCVCGSCGKSFSVPPCVIKEGGGKYCSFACRVKAQKGSGKPSEYHFWKYVVKGDGCWEWSGALYQNGYGAFSEGTYRTYAHRFSWKLHNGPIPEGMHICHKCDNPRCVRPDHLFLGTPADNMQDMVRKGRSGTVRHPEIIKRGDDHWTHRRPELTVRGERHGCAKLTEAQVILIRQLHSDGRSIRSLAREFSIAQKTAAGIVHRRAWKHIE